MGLGGFARQCGFSLEEIASHLLPSSLWLPPYGNVPASWWLILLPKRSHIRVTMCHSCIPGWNEWRFGQREWRKSCKAAIFLIRIWFFEHQLKIKIRTDRKHLHWTGFSERWVTEASLVHVNGASFDFLFTVYLFHSRVVSCGTLLGSVQTSFVYLVNVLLLATSLVMIKVEIPNLSS